MLAQITCSWLYRGSFRWSAAKSNTVSAGNCHPATPISPSASPGRQLVRLPRVTVTEAIDD